jgi:hypothetical protein
MLLRITHLLLAVTSYLVAPPKTQHIPWTHVTRAQRYILSHV